MELEKESSESRQFRIYASSQAGRVVGEVWDESLLETYIEAVRAMYPDDDLYVREVVETVVQIIRPDGTVIDLEERSEGNKDKDKDKDTAH